MKNFFDKQPISNEAPQGLRNRVELAARQKPAKSWFAPRYRWAAAGTAVAAATVGAVLFLMPSKAEAKTWDMVQQAYQKVRGVLIQMEFSGDGDNGKLTIAGKGDDWRVSVEGMDGGKNGKMDISYSGGELTLWEGGDTAQVIDLGINIPFSPEQLMTEMTTELTASNILKEGADDIGRENIRVEQPVFVNGKRVYNVYVNEPHGEGQFHILVDADSDLPISMDVKGPRGESMRMSFQFNGDFDNSFLQPVLPSGIKFERIDKNTLGGHGGDFMEGMKDFHFKLGDDGHEDRVEVKDQVRIEQAIRVS